MNRSLPNRIVRRRRSSMNQALQELAPDVAVLADFAFRESRRRRWLSREVTFESWLISAIFERADVLIQHGILAGEERKRFVMSVCPTLIGDGLTIYFEA